MRNFVFDRQILLTILLSLVLLGCSNSDSPPETKNQPGGPIITPDETCDNGATDYPACTSFASCGDTAHNQSEKRIRYQLAMVEFGQTCNSEMQTQLCSNGTLSDWTGSFTFESCTILPNSDKDFDGVLNEIDNCVMESNTNQSDINNDGIGDVCDPYYYAQLSVIFNF